MNNKAIEISQSNLENLEVSLVKTIDALSSQGYLINRNKLLRVSIIQMVKHCYDNIPFLTEEEIDNLSNIVINV